MLLGVDQPGPQCQRMTTHSALTRNRNLGASLSTVSTPVCGPRDVMIAPRFAGLCGTDIQIFRGAQRALANTLGHEGVGTVVEVGELVGEYVPGDAVVFNPLNPSNPADILGHSFDGIFQERILVRDISSTGWLIQKVPGDMLGPIGALIEPVATAVYSHELVGRSSHGRVAVVVGDGPIALINSIVLRLYGFETVLMIHGRSPRYAWAVDHGYIDRSDMIFGWGEVAERIIERLGGALADAAIICTPGETVEQALRDALVYLRPGGTINFVSAAVPSVASIGGRDLNVGSLRRQNCCGLPSTGHVEKIDTATGKRVTVTGQSGTSRSHINTSVELLSDHYDQFAGLITDVMELAGAPELVSAAVAWSFGRPEGGRAGGKRPMKAVIELNRGEF